MTSRIDLAEAWSGNQEECDLSGINLLIPPEVSDRDMNCGGRAQLDKRLRLSSGEKTPLPCGECAVKSVCAFGLDLG